MKGWEVLDANDAHVAMFANPADAEIAVNGVALVDATKQAGKAMGESIAQQEARDRVDASALTHVIRDRRALEQLRNEVMSLKQADAGMTVDLLAKIAAVGKTLDERQESIEIAAEATREEGPAIPRAPTARAVASNIAYQIRLLTKLHADGDAAWRDVEDTLVDRLVELVLRP